MEQWLGGTDARLRNYTTISLRLLPPSKLTRSVCKLTLLLLLHGLFRGRKRFSKTFPLFILIWKHFKNFNNGIKLRVFFKRMSRPRRWEEEGMYGELLQYKSLIIISFSGNTGICNSGLFPQCSGCFVCWLWVCIPPIGGQLRCPACLCFPSLL